MGKNFKGGINTLLDGSKDKDKGEAQRGRPRTNFKTIEKSSQLGTKEHETRATFIVNEDQLKSLKALAYLGRVTIKEVLAEAIADHLKAKKRELNQALDLYEKNKAS